MHFVKTAQIEEVERYIRYVHHLDNPQNPDIEEIDEQPKQQYLAARMQKVDRQKIHDKYLPDGKDKLIQKGSVESSVYGTVKQQLLTSTHGTIK